MNFKANDTKAGFFILLLHAVGIVGYLIPSLNQYFLLLTPLNLTIVLITLTYFHRQYQIGSYIKLAGVFIIGLTAEIIGVKYGFLFGQYYYGDTLGVKILEVPIVIGFNWLVLGYIFGAISQYFIKNKILSVIAGSLSMVLIDFMIEPVAIKYDYWHWINESVPLMNYLGWFLIGIPVQLIIQSMDLKKMLRIVLLLLIAQSVFFLFLNIFMG